MWKGAKEGALGNEALRFFIEMHLFALVCSPVEELGKLFLY